MSSAPIPFRQIRATFDDRTIVVYQAYNAQIAELAVAAGKFVAPFKTERMTWIKPSFLWMMYRCGWATKPGQERVLAITITRDGFEEALARSCLAHFDDTMYESHDAWLERKGATPVTIQWDPERSLMLQRLEHRSLQIGLGPEVVPSYVNDWTVGIADVTPTAHEIHKLVASGKHDEASALLPNQEPYPLPADIAEIVGASQYG